MLRIFGDKARARAAATSAGVPVIDGTRGGITLEEAFAFFDGLGHGGEIMLKAVAGGGGRGMRAVRRRADLESSFERCRSEATAAFGSGDLYAEELWLDARHVEVQIVGDGAEVIHLGERDCSVQRRHQKLVEIAPAPGLSPELRDRLCAAAVAISRAVEYESLGTIEFLVEASGAGSSTGRFAFIEANPRLQVEHPVTEEVTGIDLVATQLSIAGGRTLADLRLRQDDVPRPQGCAIELRINMERMTADGGAMPAGGTLSVYEPPSGRGIRVDGAGYAGYTPSGRFDSLLAKLVVRSSTGYEGALAKAYAALCAFRIDGVDTNLDFLRTVARHPRVMRGELYTRLVDDHLAELAAGGERHRALFFEGNGDAVRGDGAARATPNLAGVRVDPRDPLAVLDYGRAAAAASSIGRPSGSRRARRRGRSRCGRRSRAPSSASWSARATRCGAARRS